MVRVAGSNVTPVIWAADAAGTEMSRIARVLKSNKVFLKKHHDICFFLTNTPPRIVCSKSV
jgi:hypothetical protein